MAQDMLVYFIDENKLKTTQVKMDGKSIEFTEWLKTKPAPDMFWEVALSMGWQGVNLDGAARHVTNFRRGVGRFPDLKRLKPYLTKEILKRFTPIGTWEANGHVFDLLPYEASITLPLDYDGMR